MLNSFSSHLSLLNQTTLESLSEKNKFNIIKNFTETGIKILGADFGFAWWKTDNNKKYHLAYKSQGTPYQPNMPRNKGGNDIAQKTGSPVFMERVNSLFYKPKYDVSPFMKSYAIIPVCYKKTIYGNLVLCFRRRRKFVHHDKSLCSALGNFAAQAITINSLYNNLRESRNELAEKVKFRTRELEEKNSILEQDKAYDEALLSSIGEGIIATDSQMRIILINARAIELLGGGGQKEYLGKLIQEKMPLYDSANLELNPDNRPTYLAMTKRYKTHTATFTNFTTRSEDGRVVPVSITVTPIILKGHITGAIQIIRDITEEKRIDTAKSELISLASHQLRTPLAAINWYSEALLSGDLGKLQPEQKKYLKQIFSANQKMIELVYDFLNVSRIELGTFTLKITRLDVEEVAEDILRELEPQIKAKNLAVSRDFGKGLQKLNMDRKILRIIFQNLLSNSVKYTETAGKIRVRCRLSPDGGQLVIEEEDNGLGIPKSQQDKIFCKLFRAENIQKLDTEGTGLGLYIMKSLVDFCKGSISFESEENKGTKFKVCLPLRTFNQQ